jgi:hypothetical protein
VVGGQSIFLRRSYLRHIERHGPTNIQPRYVLMFRDALYRIRRANRIHNQTDFVMVKDITPAQSGLMRAIICWIFCRTRKGTRFAR